ncbi:hypothetical protein D3C87_1456210 [compost metagenome]
MRGFSFEAAHLRASTRSLLRCTAVGFNSSTVSPVASVFVTTSTSSLMATISSARTSARSSLARAYISERWESTAIHVSIVVYGMPRCFANPARCPPDAMNPMNSSNVLGMPALNSSHGVKGSGCGITIRARDAAGWVVAAVPSAPFVGDTGSGDAMRHFDAAGVLGGGAAFLRGTLFAGAGGLAVFFGVGTALAFGGFLAF